MHNVLFSNKLSATQKKTKINNEYDIVTTNELGKEIELMTDLSVGFKRKITKRVTQQVREEERERFNKMQNESIVTAFRILSEKTPKAEVIKAIKTAFPHADIERALSEAGIAVIDD